MTFRVICYYTEAVVRLLLEDAWRIRKPLIITIGNGVKIYPEIFTNRMINECLTIWGNRKKYQQRKSRKADTKIALRKQRIITEHQEQERT